LVLQPDAFAVLHQSAGSQIGFENAKPQTPHRVVGLPQYNPTSVLAAVFLAVRTADNLPEDIDLVRFSGEPTVQREGSGDPLMEVAKVITTGPG
jgi:hypothetical protein